ncbi:hypothetical protein HN784_00275 [bacterium]|jgi:hypothetical protein|nr:hypothetical protein [bacterium]
MKAEELELGCGDPTCPECNATGRKKFIEDMLKLRKNSFPLLTEDDIPENLMVHINDYRRVQAGNKVLSLDRKSIEEFQNTRYSTTIHYMHISQSLTFDQETRTAKLIIRGIIPKIIKEYWNEGTQELISKVFYLQGKVVDLQEKQSQIACFYTKVMASKFALEGKMGPTPDKSLLDDIEKQETLAEEQRKFFANLAREIQKTKKSIYNGLSFLCEHFEINSRDAMPIAIAVDPLDDEPCLIIGVNIDEVADRVPKNTLQKLIENHINGRSYLSWELQKALGIKEEIAQNVKN